jgi:hypothetical protein
VTGNGSIGNALTVTNAVTAGNVVSNTNVTATGNMYTPNWYRNTGDGMVYSEKWGGGWYMVDGSWMRSYADKGIYTAGQVQAGTVQANTALYSNSQTFTYGNTYNVSNSWSFLGYDGAWGANSAPQSAIGSAYLNDAYFRSTGKWASQMGGSESGTMCGSAWWDAGWGGVLVGGYCQGYHPYYSCPPGYYSAAVFAAYSNWMYSCSKA